jgi:hypothetical protein
LQVLSQQRDGVIALLPTKQQQAQQSRVKVDLMRDSLWEAEEAAIQAKSKLDDIDAAVRFTSSTIALFSESFLYCRYWSSKICCKLPVSTGSMLKHVKST